MKLVSFSKAQGRARLGIWLADGGVLDLDMAATRVYGSAGPQFASMLALIEAGESGLDQARTLETAAPAEAMHAPGSVRLLAPIARPSRLRSTSCFPRHLTQAFEGRARILAAAAVDPERALAEGLAQLK